MPDSLEILNHQLPEVFDPQSLPDQWEDEWILIPVEDPEALGNVQWPPREIFTGDPLATPDPVAAIPPPLPAAVMSGFAGSLRSRNGGAVPPPDALAFYLPFHYFYPKWWGIYLIAEGVAELAKILLENSNHQLSLDECWHAARIFLWGHEQYHLCVESFATRLEVTHRKPLYRCGFEQHYRQTANTDQWIEEALATAYGMDKCERAFQRDRQAVLRPALMKYVESTPPGYNKAPEFLGKQRFKLGERKLAEDSHRLAVPNVAAKPPELWATFPHGFRPFCTINSQVSFLVHRDSYLAERTHLNLRYLTDRGLKERLEKVARCRFFRNGGNHEIWQNPSGRSFPVPTHTGDLKPGTLRSIIRQAGLDMSIEQFIRAL